MRYIYFASNYFINLSVYDKLRIFIVPFLITLSGCEIDIWDTNTSKLQTDTDLSNDPIIAQITADSDENLLILLNYSYSDDCNIILERKESAEFHKIDYQRSDQITLKDSTFDKEYNANFFYRVLVEKNGYQTNYSPEFNYNYISKILNAPANLTSVTIELQGLLIQWIDRSNFEDEYVIQKRDSGDFYVFRVLNENSTNLFDEINGSPSQSIHLSYRIKAQNSQKTSKWSEIETVYSGIAKPTNLRIIDATYYNFTIEWQDNSSIETGYSIERKIDEGIFQFIKQVGTGVISYTDDLSGAGVYSYRVKTMKEILFSAYSNEVSHEIASVLPPVIAYYPFNGNANDESGNGHHGIVYNADLTTDRFGNPSCAYSFSGLDYIDLGNNELVTSPFSISVWIKPTAFSTGSSAWSAIINKLTEYAIGWYLGIHPDDKIRFLIGESFTVYDIVQGGNITLNQWIHIVVTFDGANLKLYQNATLIGEKFTNVALTTNGKPLLIGIESSWMEAGFYGTIDDIRIYHLVLNDQEIEDLYYENGWNAN